MIITTILFVKEWNMPKSAYSVRRRKNAKRPVFTGMKMGRFAFSTDQTTV